MVGTIRTSASPLQRKRSPNASMARTTRTTASHPHRKRSQNASMVRMTRTTASHLHRKRSQNANMARTTRTTAVLHQPKPRPAPRMARSTPSANPAMPLNAILPTLHQRTMTLLHHTLTGHAKTPRPALPHQDASGLLPASKTQATAILRFALIPKTAPLQLATHVQTALANQRPAQIRPSAHHHQVLSGNARTHLNVSALLHAQTSSTALLHTEPTGHARTQASALFKSARIQRTVVPRVLLNHQASQMDISQQAHSPQSPRRILQA